VFELYATLAIAYTQQTLKPPINFSSTDTNTVSKNEQ